MSIVQELPRHDEHGGMIHPDVAVTHRVLIRTSTNKHSKNFEFLLWTVKKDAEICAIQVSWHRSWGK